MCVKLIPENLNSSICPPHFTDTYTCKVNYYANSMQWLLTNVLRDLNFVSRNCQNICIKEL